ncbi:MAG: hypothetical protein J0H67_07400 [Rhodospirillales bacterium]|nr:hypothetical protein [Rhodospirillales bacterium]
MSVAISPIRTDHGGGMREAFATILAAGQTALGRVGAPDDIGGLIAGRPSDDHRWVNAQNIAT